MDDEARQRFTGWAQARADRLHRTAFLMCGDWHAAQDLVQEALARTALAWRRIEQMEDPDAYVRQVLVNQARQRWRQRRTHELPSCSLPEPASADGADERADRQALVQALQHLPRRQRAVVVLRFFEQLSVAETAHALKCSEGTVKSQTSRALTALRAPSRVRRTHGRRPVDPPTV